VGDFFACPQVQVFWGVAFSDIPLWMVVPVVMLTASLRSAASITTGYSAARPLGECVPGLALITKARWPMPFV